MVDSFKAIEKIIELRKPFFDVPLVLFGFKLDIKEHCSFLGSALGVARDRYLHSRG